MGATRAGCFKMRRCKSCHPPLPSKTSLVTLACLETEKLVIEKSALSALFRSERTQRTLPFISFFGRCSLCQSLLLRKVHTSTQRRCAGFYLKKVCMTWFLFARGLKKNCCMKKNCMHRVTFMCICTFFYFFVFCTPRGGHLSYLIPKTIAEELWSTSIQRNYSHHARMSVGWAIRSRKKVCTQFSALNVHTFSALFLLIWKEVKCVNF